MSLSRPGEYMYASAHKNSIYQSQIAVRGAAFHSFRGTEDIYNS